MKLAPHTAVEGTIGFEPITSCCAAGMLPKHFMPRLPEEVEAPAHLRLFYPATRSRIRGGFIPERTHACEVASGGDGMPRTRPTAQGIKTSYIRYFSSAALLAHSGLQ